MILFVAQGSEIIQLDSSTFESITSEGRWFVKFFAPWCGHCQRLEPVWQELASKTNGDFNVAEVDCTKHALLCGRQKVSGYPMMKWYDNGEVRDYKGARETQPMLDWVKSGAPVIPAKAISRKEPGQVIKLTKDNFGQIKEGVWMVNFFAPWCSHSKKFETVWNDLGQHAEEYRVASIDISAQQDLADQYEVKGTPTVLLFKNGEYFRFAGPRSVDFLDRFARSEGLGQNFHDDKHPPEPEMIFGPHVRDLTESFDKTVAGQNVFVLFYAPWCSHCKKLFPIWEKFAQQQSENEDIIIAKVDGTKNRNLVERYSIRGYPTLMLFPAKEERVEYKGQRDVDSFDKFLHSHV